MTQLQINSKHEKYVTREVEWRSFASAGFRVLGGIREAASKKRFDGEGRLLVDRDSNYAKTFADLVVTKLERHPIWVPFVFYTISFSLAFLIFLASIQNP